MNAEQMMEFYWRSKLRKQWEMSEDIFNVLRHLRDNNGNRYWTPDPDRYHLPGCLLGIPVVLTKKPKVFQMRYVTRSGDDDILVKY